MPGEVTVLFVEVAGRPFAVEVGQVEALRRKETLYPLREGHPGLVGFLPMGGQAVPVLDLAVRLGLDRGALPAGRLLLVSALAEFLLVFQVERVTGPLALTWTDIALLPDLLRELQGRPVVWGMVWRGDDLVPLLDLGQVVPADEVDTLRTLARTTLCQIGGGYEPNPVG